MNEIARTCLAMPVSGTVTGRYLPPTRKNSLEHFPTNSAARKRNVLEFAMAYLIADRVAGLTTTDTNEGNVDVTQKKVLVARERIRVHSEEQHLVEKNRAAWSTRGMKWTSWSRCSTSFCWSSLG